ncbi:MAG: uracil phosphoribosyltransferase [Bacteroidetes bacterium]|nr:uracil phosphoribosyltransferase [Bacteroidota bacterium]
MIINLSNEHSLITNWIAEIRDVTIQSDRLRFRRNLQRIGEIAAYEISKGLPSEIVDVHTPLAIHKSKMLKHQPVLATVLRAGLPLHQGMLNYFDKADNAFISAYRKHHTDGSFEICLEYMSCPNLDNRIVIISDPMLATGASLVKTIEFMREQYKPAEIYFVCAIASKQGIEYIHQQCGNEIKIWCGDIDEKLNDKGYIVPGLGDAGDLAYGTKMQA